MRKVRKTTKKSSRKKKNDFDYFLNAPIVSSDAELAKEYAGVIIKQRKDRVKKQERLATDIETMLYLREASLRGPLTEEATNIFLFLVTKAMPDVVPNEIKQETLSDGEKRGLRELQSNLFDKMVKLQKKIEKKQQKAKDGISL